MRSSTFSGRDIKYVLLEFIEPTYFNAWILWVVYTYTLYRQYVYSTKSV